VVAGRRDPGTWAHWQIGMPTWLTGRLQAERKAGQLGAVPQKQFDLALAR
jgi:hypothetical protein